MYDKLLSSPTYQKPRLYIDWGLCRSGGLHNSVGTCFSYRRALKVLTNLPKLNIWPLLGVKKWLKYWRIMDMALDRCSGTRTLRGNTTRTPGARDSQALLAFISESQGNER